MSSTAEKKWVKDIEKNKSIMAVGKNAGNWDLTIVVRCKNNGELDNILKKVFSGKQDKIKEKLITSEIESTYFTSKLLHNMEGKVAHTKKGKVVELEETDESLVRELAKNCRISLVDLAGKVDMSANGVKNRIKLLEQRGVIIGYKTKINYQKIGYLHFRVFIHLNKYSEETYDKMKDFLKKKGNVESVSRYMGYADVDFRCHTKDVVELYRLISELKDAFLSEVISIDSMIIFDWEEIQYVKK